MHPCLRVEEIVRLVASELVASKAEETSVALACCCKNFEDPVLDSLWEIQQRLLPLLKSFPGDVWKPDGPTVSVCQQGDFLLLTSLVRKFFKRLPTTLEWARFRKYARRMRKVHEPSPLSFLSPEVLSVLQLYLINELLFPNLKFLLLWNPNLESIPFILLFLSPRTTTISIGGFKPGIPEAMIASMIATFQAQCPNLQEIGLLSLPNDPMVITAVSGLLLTTNRNALQSFHVGCPLTQKAYDVVCKLPGLHTLAVVIERGPSLPSVVLPNLVRLLIRYSHDVAG